MAAAAWAGLRAWRTEAGLPAGHLPAEEARHVLAEEARHAASDAASEC
jgi:hypothetical protein